MFNDHTDAEFARREHQSEMGTLASEDARWFRWTNEVEALLGIKSLDGDQDADGYSLDYANDHYDDGETPAQYAETVRRGWDARAEGQ